MLSNASYDACPLIERVERPSLPDEPVSVYLREPATGDDFLAWLVAERATVDSFERLATSLEDIFVRVASPEVTP